MNVVTLAPRYVLQSTVKESQLFLFCHSQFVQMSTLWRWDAVIMPWFLVCTTLIELNRYLAECATLLAQQVESTHRESVALGCS